MADSFSDGSSVRIKVAQYSVDKKLQELESKNPQVKIGDWKYLQALPRYGIYEPDPESDPESESAQQGDDSALLQGVDEPLELPPLIPTHPDASNVSWNNLLKGLKDGVLDAKPSDPPKDRKPEPKFPPERLVYPPWYYVAIIGAGVAGLRTAKLLQDKGIPYKIFEASNRPGGRLFTYQFSSEENDYYDVGAMRFPKNDANKRTFELFDELGLTRDGKIVDYVLSIDENIRYYNDIKSDAKQASTAGDHFEDVPFVPADYPNMTLTDLWGRDLAGVDACTAKAFDPFRKPLLDDFEKGWEKLMEYDWASTRSYLTREVPYPLPVVHWMETRNSGTGGYDRAFSEDILDSLEFDDPTKKIEWKRLKGGSKVLIDAMLKQLFDKPFYRQHVTSVEQVYLRPLDCFPDLIRHCPRRWRPWLPYRFPFLSVRASGRLLPEYFTHVVSAVSFANLGTIDTDRVLMSYRQRQAIRTLGYGPAVKVGIKFKTRWWEKSGINQRGGSSYTDRQSRVVVYPSYGIGDTGTGVLMVTYNWHQDASRYGALIKNPDWSEQLDPARERPPSEQVLLDQIYGDLATLHGVTEQSLRDDTLDYHAFYWYSNPYTMGAYAHFAPGDFNTFFTDIVQPAARGRFHFAGEVASHHHAWVAGALDSSVRVVNEILRWDFPIWFPTFKLEKSLVFSDEEKAEKLFVRGLFSTELEEAGL